MPIMSPLSCICRVSPAFVQARFERSETFKRKRDFYGFVKPINCSSFQFGTPAELVSALNHPNYRPSPSSSRSSDISNFRPPPPAEPLTPEVLRTELPFQHWYSYSDRPAGVPKRRLRNPCTENGVPDDDDRFFSASGKVENGAKKSGRLWQAVHSEEGTSLSTDLGSQRHPLGHNLWDTSRAEGRGILSPNLEEKFRKATESRRRRELGGSDLEQVGTNQEDLSEKDMQELIQTCQGSSRQINIGWGGWKPTYVALIHSYWKRSRVCKLICKGLVTVDMDSMCSKLEAQTGGKVIGRRGGVVYLFRGLDYNFWRDARQLTCGRHGELATDIPKRLPIPCNLSEEDVASLRSKGRELPPLTRLGENGVYLTLVDDIRKAFRTQDLVRVNCQDLYSRNFKSLAFTLQALVPCELISFEFEHILMWKRQEGSL